MHTPTTPTGAPSRGITAATPRKHPADLAAAGVVLVIARAVLVWAGFGLADWPIPLADALLLGGVLHLYTRAEQWVFA